MVSGAEDGLRFWDVETGSQETWLPTGAYSRAHFAGSKPLMIWWDGAQNRLSCSQVRCDPERNSVRIDRPLASLRADTIIALRGSRDGRQLTTVGDRGPQLFHLPALIRSTVFQSHKDVSLISISPDRRWAAPAGHDAMDVRIWDVRSGRFIKELPTGMLTNVAFSPDGKWLATGNTRRSQYWRVSTWALDREIPARSRNGPPRSHRLLRDGKQAALGISQSTVNLYDSGSGSLLARLECPGENLVTPSPQFSPDSAYLATGTECGAVYLWDFRRIRARLAKMGLDWDQPPIPAKRAAIPLKLSFEPAQAPHLARNPPTIAPNGSIPGAICRRKADASPKSHASNPWRHYSRTIRCVSGNPFLIHPRDRGGIRRELIQNLFTLNSRAFHARSL